MEDACTMYLAVCFPAMVIVELQHLVDGGVFVETELRGQVNASS
jgi:hypothetical protein